MKTVLAGNGLRRFGKKTSSIFFSLALLFIACDKTQAQWSVDGFNPNANNLVHSIVVQPDGKILIGGDFTSIGGQTRNRIARLNADGSLDESFNPNANNRVNEITIQPDGMILVGGSFTLIGGQTRNHLARLNPDGTLDNSFADPNIGNQYSSIFAMVLQPDGKILLGGTFPTVGGQERKYMARLNSDGSLDASFNPNPNNSASEIVVKRDGKILFSGVFTTVAGQNRFHLAQINADGSLDASFNPNSNFDAGYVSAILLQPDGKILLGGSGSILGRNSLARINADGSPDTSFASLSFDYPIWSLARQPDGSILLGGSFDLVNGQTRKGLAKLSADGLLDPFFYPNIGGSDPSPEVLAVTVQTDGKILAGGEFNTIDGQNRNYIARIKVGSAAENPVPYISTTSPNTVVPNSIPFELTVGGGNFVPNSVIRLNGQNKNTTVVSATQLKTQITAADLPTAGQYSVTVFNPGPGGGTSSEIYFFYDCTFSIDPPFQIISRAGGNGSFNVTAANGCGWNATSSVLWVTVTSGSGNGNGTVNFTVAPNDGQARRGTITVAGRTFNIQQDGDCAFFLTPESANVSWLGTGEEVSFFVETQVGCTWRPVSNVPWITITDFGSGNGNGTVKFRYIGNDGDPRTGTIAIGDKTFTVNQGSGCFYSIPNSSGHVSASGGTGSFFIRNSGIAGCSISYRSTVSWITVTGVVGANVNYSVAASDGQARAGEIIVTVGNGMNLIFRIFQAAGCPYTFTPANQDFGASGGNGNFAVTTAAGCTWSATTNDNWINLTGGASGTGNGTIGFSVAANSGPTRSGNITVGDRTFTVTQASGCTFTITPNNQLFPSSGGTGNFVLTASNNFCGWQVAYNVDWIWGFQATGGNGSRSFSFSVGPNTGAARTATITIGGQSFTVDQAAGNCSVTLSPASIAAGAAGGDAVFGVNAPQGCAWTATANSSWITVRSAGTGLGNGTIAYSIAANNGPARNGGITIGNQTFVVVQASGCIYSLSGSLANFTANGGSGNFNVSAAGACAWSVDSAPEWITINSGSGTGNGAVSFGVRANSTMQARSGIINVGGQSFTVNQAAARKTQFDFDGDGRADVSVFRPSNGAWYITNSSTNSFFGTEFGQSGDFIAPADFDGDGRTDFSVFRAGFWYRINSSTSQFAGLQFGVAEDIPVPADFDGDGLADIAVFRPSNSTWYRINSRDNEFVSFKWGTAGDKPLTGDFDGDGKADYAVFRPSDGNWYIIKSSDNLFYAVNFGVAEDIPTASDFDGDGKTDIAVFRPSAGSWYRVNSSNGQFIGRQFGVNADIPVAADYDGDGQADIAVFRNGNWYFSNSTNGDFRGLQFGVGSDKPVPQTIR